MNQKALELPLAAGTVLLHCEEGDYPPVVEIRDRYKSMVNGREYYAAVDPEWRETYLLTPDEAKKEFVDSGIRTENEYRSIHHPYVRRLLAENCDHKLKAVLDEHGELEGHRCRECNTAMNNL